MTRQFRYAAQEFFANISIDNYNLESLQSIAAGQPNDPQFASSIASVRNLLKTAQRMVEEPSVADLPFMSFGNIERILSFRGSSPLDESEKSGLISDVNPGPAERIVQTSFTGGRTGMDAMVRATAAQRK